MEALIVIGFVGICVLIMLLVGAVNLTKSLLYICEPNEVLIFSGTGPKGYRIIKGGKKLRVPLIQTVDRIELTNMIIDVHVENAYSAGGIPLTVQGVANIKVGSTEHVLEHAVERLLGKSREQIMAIGKEILEGTVRGVLAQLTPEQVNEDKMKFAEQLLHESEGDLTRLGLVLDTMKIQNVHDDRGYLDSIGRTKSAEIIKRSRIAEAHARADATIKDAKNRENARLREIQAEEQIAIAKANRRIKDAQGQLHALVAEQRGEVDALIAKAIGAIEAEKARVEKTRRQLQADVIEPAKAQLSADIDDAKGKAAKISEDGRATVQVLQEMITVWKKAGPNAREIFLMQKMDVIMAALVQTIGDVKIDKLIMLPKNSGSGDTTVKAVKLVEEFKAVLGMDLPKMLHDYSQKN